MIALLALLAILDLLLLFGAMLAGQGAIIWFGPAHLLLTVGILLLLTARLRDFTAIQSFALPIGAAFGPAGIMVCLLLSPLVRNGRARRQIVYRHGPVRENRSMNSVSPAERLGRILDERVRYPECDEIGSLATMLRYGTLQARYRALETAVISFEPRLSPLIVMALADEDQTIRALAAAAAAQVSYNLALQRSELQARIALSQNLDDRYALTMLLADHGCFNQLLPKAQRLRLCQEASRKLGEIAGAFMAHDGRRRALRAVRTRLRREMEQSGAVLSSPAGVSGMGRVP
ncbi:hypothetical protein [Sphingobium sp. Sx8-8]|uniref:hypothetical protein n=1 Tax=Sphingobium sp. Sx8-8 TaxID=2933617 RepID=UPI001F59D16B